MEDTFTRCMEELVKENMAKYDFVFYFPVNRLDFAQDGFRDTGRAYRLTVDALIRGLINEFKIPAIEVVGRDLNEKAAAILMIIETHRQKGEGLHS